MQMKATITIITTGTIAPIMIIKFDFSDLDYSEIPSTITELDRTVSPAISDPYVTL